MSTSYTGHAPSDPGSQGLTLPSQLTSPLQSRECFLLSKLSLFLFLAMCPWSNSLNWDPRAWNSSKNPEIHRHICNRKTLLAGRSHLGSVLNHAPPDSESNTGSPDCQATHGQTAARARVQTMPFSPNSAAEQSSLGASCKTPSNPSHPSLMSSFAMQVHDKVGSRTRSLSAAGLCLLVLHTS